MSLAAARTAIRLGLSVALIEKYRLGGNSLDTGSIPSKTIIRTAKVYATTHRADEFGAPASAELPADFHKKFLVAGFACVYLGPNVLPDFAN